MVQIKDEIYLTIGEAGEELGIEPHTLRYWEKEFKDFLKQNKAAIEQQVVLGTRSRQPGRYQGIARGGTVHDSGRAAPDVPQGQREERLRARPGRRVSRRIRSDFFMAAAGD